MKASSLPSYATAAALLALVGTAPSLLAAGFTEPPIVLYGSVTQDANGYHVPLTTGTVAWTITPAGGAPFTVKTALSAKAGGVNYRLEIPVEKVPSGFTVSPATIAAVATAKTIARGSTQLSDGTALNIVSAESGVSSSFSYAENQRGLVERVDLGFGQSYLDTDGDGLPDWFEDLYGLDKYNPADALTAVDAAGQRYSVDYANHVTPPVLSQEYRTWATTHTVPGAPNSPLDGDPDHDGISNLLEFALDTNPLQPDAALNHSRAAVALRDSGGKSYLTMAITKPATPRTSVGYVVESSGNLQDWNSVENTDVVTLSNGSGLLEVRDVKAVGSAAGGNFQSAQPAQSTNSSRYLRLRIVLQQ